MSGLSPSPRSSPASRTVAALAVEVVRTRAVLRFGRAESPGRRGLLVFFATCHHYLSEPGQTDTTTGASRPTDRARRVRVFGTYLRRLAVRAAGGHPNWIVAPS